MIPDNKPNERPTIYKQIENLQSQINDQRRLIKSQYDEIEKLRESIAVINHSIVSILKKKTVSTEEEPKVKPVLYTATEIATMLKSENYFTSTTEVVNIFVRFGYIGVYEKNRSIFPKQKGIISGIIVSVSTDHAKFTIKARDFLISYFKGEIKYD